jgi:uncharacterized membrane protein
VGLHARDVHGALPTTPAYHVRVTGPEVWREFDHDPRHPEHAPMRASDADRDIVLRTLGEAYAEGRLDREEYDERSDAVAGAKTLGELPEVLADLVPTSAVVPYVGAGALDTRSIEEQSIGKWEKSRRDAVMGFLIPTVVCWVSWGLTMFGGFPWPIFATIGSGFPLIAMTVQKKDMIESNKRRIVRKQERELRRQQKRELPPPS